MSVFGWIILVVAVLAVAWVVDWIIDHIGGGGSGEHTIDDYHETAKKI